VEDCGGVRVNFLSLFAGIGGFDLGLERAGMKVVPQIPEIIGRYIMEIESNLAL